MVASLMSLLKGKPNYLKWNKEALQTFQKFTAFQCILGYQPPLFLWSGEPNKALAVNKWMRRCGQTSEVATPKSHLQREVLNVQKSPASPTTAYLPHQDAA